jgi:fumarate reductase flavoprotein subunit
MTTPSTLHCDVVVAGGALAGLSAALYALGKGRKVVLLEATERTGGTALFSGGAIHIGGAQTWEDYKKQVPHADPVLGKELADRYVEYVQWLASTGAPGRAGMLVYRDQSFYGFQMGGTSLPIGKQKFFDYLHKKLVQMGGTILLQTRARRLITDGGHVKGIVAVQDGREITINAKSVVLATGGFQANPELVQKYICRPPEHSAQRTISADRGDGLQMALDVGAKLCDRMDSVYGHMLPAPPARIDWSHSGTYLEPILMSSYYAKNSIVVNVKGERFADEGPGETNAMLANTACQQPAGGLWVIMDHAIRRDFGRYEIPKDAFWRLSSLRYLPLMKYFNLQTVPYASGPRRVFTFDSIGLSMDRGALVLKAPSIDDLAAQLARHGVNGNALKKTIAEFNPRVANGTALGLPIPKTKLAQRIDQAPFYAIKVVAGISLTHGGVAIDTRAQVLDKNDAPIPGLFAAPGTAGGIHHLYYGGSHSTCGVFGMIAGESASAAVG